MRISVFTCEEQKGGGGGEVVGGGGQIFISFFNLVLNQLHLYSRMEMFEEVEC